MSQTDEFEELRADYAEKQARIARRAMERRWAKIVPTPNEIRLRWHQSPVRGEQATVGIWIGAEELEFCVDPETAFYRQKVGTNQTPNAYKAVAEAYALWKWHTARCTPVDERDNYQVEPGFVAPVFSWEPEIPAFKDKRAA